MAIEADFSLDDKVYDGNLRVSYADYSGLPPETRVIQIQISAPEFAHVADEIEARGKCQAAVRLFKRLCQQCKVLYGSVTVDYELESPEQLVNDPRSYAFSDFFIDGSYFWDVVNKVKEGGFNAYVEEMEGGLYVSMTKYFNPAKLDSGPERTKQSSRIARGVATTLSQRFGRQFY